VLIVLLAYNEADNLPHLLSELQEECGGCDVIVIDDGSTNKTTRYCVEVVKRCGLG
jgi:glycosyltransferase involved in cell wall biosynthesis